MYEQSQANRPGHPRPRPGPWEIPPRQRVAGRRCLAPRPDPPVPRTTAALQLDQHVRHGHVLGPDRCQLHGDDECPIGVPLPLRVLRASVAARSDELCGERGPGLRAGRGGVHPRTLVLRRDTRRAFADRGGVRVDRRGGHPAASRPARVDLPIAPGPDTEQPDGILAALRERLPRPGDDHPSRKGHPLDRGRFILFSVQPRIDTKSPILSRRASSEQPPPAAAMFGEPMP